MSSSTRTWTRYSRRAKHYLFPLPRTELLFNDKRAQPGMVGAAVKHSRPVLFVVLTMLSMGSPVGQEDGGVHAELRVLPYLLQPGRTG